MSNIKQINLDNGLKIVLNRDNKKHHVHATIIVNAGANNNEFYVNNKKVIQPYGVAHFLEHYLIERSIYGNLSNIFSKDYVNSNGYTSNDRTVYFIDTVHDFKENFIKLLNLVNNPKFDEESVELTKKPIVAEINRKNDNKNIAFMDCVFKSVFKTKYFNIGLGNPDDILNMNINTLKDFYDAFYRPENQMIILTGNFPKNIVSLIKKEYANFNYKKIKVKRVPIIENDKVIKKRSIYSGELKESFFNITYKINLSKLTPLEKNKLDYYFGYLLQTNFGEESKLFNYLIQNKLSLYAIDYNFNPKTVGDYLLISFVCYTNEFDKVIKLINDKFNNLEIEDKTFTTWKNQSIIGNINNFEKINWITDNFINNVLLYNLYQVDDVNFIKNLNIKECKTLLNKIDKSNYSIVKNIYNK
ncbi:MAG: insulinase family protein [Bacilli bacterium]|nr:insulinase family protein [Bacilli bacterium]